MVNIDLSEIKLISTYIKDMESTDDFRAVPITFNGEAVNQADYFPANWHFHENHFYNAVDLLDRIERRKAEQIRAALDPPEIDPEMEWFANPETGRIEQRPVPARRRQAERGVQAARFQPIFQDVAVQGGGGGFFFQGGQEQLDIGQIQNGHRWLEARPGEGQVREGQV